MKLIKSISIIVIILSVVSCVHKQPPLAHTKTTPFKPIHHLVSIIHRHNPLLIPKKLNIARQARLDQRHTIKNISDKTKAPISLRPKKHLKKLTNMIRSRYGNPAVYHVRGKEYEVKASSKGYKEQGLASWYGKDFHLERTSSGEVYDMYGMTAAHKTLPLPTLVKVTNLDNKRHVILKVNDRGPFHEGRIIDLSFAAAKALKLDRKGVGRVEVESLTDKHAPDPHWFLQVGAFDKMNQARNLAKYVADFISLPISIIKERGNNLVQIGPLQDKTERLEVKNTLLQHGIRDMFAFIR